MKLVISGIDDKRNSIVQFSVFVHPYNQQHLTLYQLETVPVPIIGRNENTQSYTHLKVTKPCIALNSEKYISLRIQELETCKKIGYEFYCEKLLVVKHRSQHNCKSAIYFDSNADIIKETCEFQYYYNKTDIIPSDLDGRCEIITANWPKTKYVVCNDNHEYPIKIPTLFDNKLLKVPETMKGLVQQYRQTGQTLKIHESKTKNKFFENIAIDIFLFIAAIISMSVVIAIIHIVCKHVKLKTLLTGIAFQPIKQTEAVVTSQIQQHCTAQWYAIAALTLMIVLLIIYICLTMQRCTIFKRRLYSNTVTIMLFFSDIKQYIPVKLSKSVSSIRLFQIYGQLSSDQKVLEKNCLWDMITINWKEVFVTLNSTMVQMPKSVKVLLRDKYKLRTLMEKHTLLLHVILKQGPSWYALDNIDYMLPPPMKESEI